MRGLTRKERDYLLELNRPGPDVEAAPGYEAHTDFVQTLRGRGLVVVAPEGAVLVTDITADGRLALRVCTVTP